MAISRSVLLSLFEKDTASYLDSSHKEIHPWMSTQEVAVCLQRKCLFKKFEEAFTEDQKALAVSDLLIDNERCRTFKLPALSLSDSWLLSNVKQVLHEFFNSSDSTIFEAHSLSEIEPEVGRGVAVGSRHSDLYRKLYGGALAASSSTLNATYHRLCCKNDTWFAAEYLRMENHGAPNVVKGSRLSVVYKDERTGRPIDIQPVINQRFQQAFKVILSKRLVEFFSIDFRSQQDVNRRMAISGSVDGNFCTIDLKNASNFSVKMFSKLVSHRVIRDLVRVRSPYMSVPTRASGNSEVFHKLYILGTMGNGFTFPLQTSLYASIVVAAFRCLGENVPRASDSTWSVYGDDIIVPQRIFRYVIRILTILGFTINNNKTFHEGPFRESCGVDAFKGINVRPVYIKYLDSTQSRYVVINSLVRWSVRHDVPLPRTINYLLSSVRFTAVPPDSPEDSGIHVPCPRERTDKNGSFIYMAYEPRARRWGFRVDPSTLEPYLSTHGPYNLVGLYAAFLQGSLKNEGILRDSCNSDTDLHTYYVGVRGKPHQHPTYVLRRRITPYWGYVAPKLDLLDPLERRRWNALAPRLLNWR